MKEIFAYVIGLGAAVMMPVIFTILGVCIGIKLSKALKSGLLVGVGFVGLGVVTALLTSSLGPALKGMTLRLVPPLKAASLKGIPVSSIERSILERAQMALRCC